MRTAHNGDFFFAILKRRNRIGDDIMMLHIRHGNINACHLRDLPRIATGRIDDDFGTNSALFGLHIPFARRQLGQARHTVFADNLCPHIFRTNGKRIANTRWISMSVFGGTCASNNPVQRHKRIMAQDFLWRDDFHIKANDFGKTLYIAHPRQLALVRRKANSARCMPADILPRQPFQLGIELIAISMHFSEVVAARNVWTLPGGVPSRAGRQLILFNQQTICPAKLGKMEKQRSSHYAAANDDNPCRCLHDSRAP